MLERASTCLESGARLSLRCASRSDKHKRKLHAAFWQPNNHDLDVPLLSFDTSTWSDAGARRKSRTDVDTGSGIGLNAAIGTQESGFLDFLYPRQALAYLSQTAVQHESWERRNARRLPSGFVPASRRFSSSWLLIKDQPVRGRQNHNDEALHPKLPQTSQPTLAKARKAVPHTSNVDRSVSEPRIEEEASFDSLHDSLSQASAIDHIGSWSDVLDVTDNDKFSQDVAPEPFPAHLQARQEPVFPGSGLATASRIADKPYKAGIRQQNVLSKSGVEVKRRDRTAKQSTDALVRQTPRSKRLLTRAPPRYARTGLLGHQRHRRVARQQSWIPVEKSWLQSLTKPDEFEPLVENDLQGAAHLLDTIKQVKTLIVARNDAVVNAYVDIVWKTWMSLDISEQSQVDLIEAMMDFLAARQLEPANDFAIDLYNSVPVVRRTLSMYNLIVPVLLRCGLIGLAEAAHEEAWHQYRCADPVAFNVLAGTLQARQWDMAFKIYEQICEGGNIASEYTRLTLWTTICQREDLFSVAVELTQHLETRDWSIAQNRPFLDFACAFIEASAIEDVKKTYLAQKWDLRRYDPRSFKLNLRAELVVEERQNAAMTIVDTIIKHKPRDLAARCVHEMLSLLLLPRYRIDFRNAGHFISQLLYRYKCLAGELPREDVATIFRDYQVKLFKYAKNRRAAFIAKLPFSPMYLASTWRETLGGINAEGLINFMKYHASIGDVVSTISYRQEYDALVAQEKADVPLAHERPVEIRQRYWAVWKDAHEWSTHDLASTILVHAVRRDLPAAYAAFEQLRQDAKKRSVSVELNCWEALMLAYVWTGDIRGARGLLDTIVVESGFDIAPFLTLPLLEVYGYHSDFMGIEDILSRYAQDRGTLPIAMLDSVLLALTRDGRPYDAARYLLDTVLANAVKTRQTARLTPSFNIVLEAYSAAAPSVVMGLLRLMKEHVIRKDAGTYEALARHYIEHGKTGAAYRLIDRTMSWLGLEASIRHWSLVMEGYTREGKPLRTIMVYQELLARGYRPDPACQRLYDAALCRPGGGYRYQLKRQRLLARSQALLQQVFPPQDASLPKFLPSVDTDEAIAYNLEEVGRLARKFLFYDIAHNIVDTYKQKYTEMCKQYDAIASQGDSATRQLQPIPQAPSVHVQICNLQMNLALGEHRWDDMSTYYTELKALVDRNLMRGRPTDWRTGTNESSKQDGYSRLPTHPIAALSQLIAQGRIDWQQVMPRGEVLRPSPAQLFLMDRRTMHFAPNVPNSDQQVLAVALAARLFVARQHNDIPSFVKILNSYLSEGYLLSRKTANSVVRMCAQFRPPLLALAYGLNESSMLKNWQGWQTGKFHNRAAQRRHEHAGTLRMHARDVRHDEVALETPAYKMLFHATRPLMVAASKGESAYPSSFGYHDRYIGTSLARLKAIAPRTLAIVQNIPRELRYSSLRMTSREHRAVSRRRAMFPMQVRSGRAAAMQSRSKREAAAAGHVDPGNMFDGLVQDAAVEEVAVQRAVSQARASWTLDQLEEEGDLIHRGTSA